ncbi:MAG: site-specific DNA-methyltransferase [Defluviitaleaceae bacterium]|nr:site-specific DNA-methyltransferase [Defluviitaleaceae bacterium]
MVYIDPPFSTSNIFTVCERTSTISRTNGGTIAYSDKFSKGEFLDFLRQRLLSIRELMSEQGSIYLHIDTKIGHYVKILMDEVFGEENFLSEITRKKSNPKNFSRKTYGNEKDVIYFYAKYADKHIWNNITIHHNKKDLERIYPKIDTDGRRYNTVPLHAPGETVDGATGGAWKGMNPPAGRHWRTSPKELDILDAKGLIEWSKNGNPRLKKFADEHKGKKIQDIWLDFKDPQYPKYPTQKNYDMLDLIIRQSSSPSSWVLDVFMGSGTTLVAAKNNGRQFVGIDNSEIAINIARKLLCEV